MNRFIHFELASEEPEKTAAFYRDVFGWQIQKWDGPFDYWLVTTGEDGVPGINGAITTANGDFRGTINTVQVEDIDEAIARVQAHGAEIALEKGAIPGVGYVAYFKDPLGMLVGLHQADPNAMMEE